MRFVIVWLVFMAACTTYRPLYVTVSACQSHQQSLDVSLSVLNAVRDGFMEFDKNRPMQIAETAETREEAETVLAAYRLKRAAVTAALLTTYRAISIAAAQPSEQSMRDVGNALAMVIDQMRQLGVFGYGPDTVLASGPSRR